VLLSALLALCSTLCLGEQERRLIMDEWGPVECMGVLLYVGMIIALVGYSRHDRPFFIHTAVIVTIMSARELDVQKAFTSKNFLNKNFYRDGLEGLTHEQVGAMIALGIIGLIAVTYLRYLPRLIANMRRGKPFAFSIAAVFLAIPLSLSLDGAYRVLNNEMGLPLSLSVKHFMSSLEECLETCIPILMLLALLQYRTDRNKHGSGQPNEASGSDGDDQRLLNQTNPS
jgi:hypothetical protein